MIALRTITILDGLGLMSKAMAFLKQAQIAYERNDLRRAQHWARKAKSLDAELVEADAFLQQIGD